METRHCLRFWRASARSSWGRGGLGGEDGGGGGGPLAPVLTLAATRGRRGGQGPAAPIITHYYALQCTQQYKIRQKIHQVYQVPHVPDTLSTQQHATACSQYAQQCTPWQYQYKIRQQVIRSLRLRKILSVWVSTLTPGGINVTNTKSIFSYANTSTLHPCESVIQSTSPSFELA